MKKRTAIISTALITAIIMFGTGVYAANNGWLTFEGDVEKSENHVDEIMVILRQVNDDKISAEEALAELEDMNPEALIEKVEELHGRINELHTVIVEKDTEIIRLQGELADAQNNAEGDSEYIAHLEAELTTANDKVDGINTKTQSAVDEARTYIGEDE